jgi:cytochrome b561
MAEMSPLARLLLVILHKGAWGAAAAVLAVACLVVWQRWTPAGPALQQGDPVFLAVLVGLFLLAVYLVRGIRRELDANPRDKG